MIGNNSAEIGGGFVNASSSKEELFSLFGELKEEAKAAYDPDGTKEFAEVQTRFNTDKVWAEPARFTASAFAAVGDPAYIFLFSYVPSSMKERMKYGPGHGTDISYAFNNLGLGGFGTPPPPPTAEDKEVARMMNAYWVNFARGLAIRMEKDCRNGPFTVQKRMRYSMFNRMGNQSVKLILRKQDST